MPIVLLDASLCFRSVCGFICSRIILIYGEATAVLFPLSLRGCVGQSGNIGSGP